MKLRRLWVIVGAMLGLAVMAGVSQARGLNLQVVNVPNVACTWNGPTGNWNDSTKWSCGAVPGAADTAIVSSGTITLTADVTVNTLTFSNGIIQGTSNLTATAMTWTGGTFTGSGTTTLNCTLNMSDSSVTLDGRTFNNAGSATFGGSSVYLILYNGAVFNNQAGASLQFSHTSTGQITYSTGGGTFNNSGAITKTFGSSGFTYMYATFNNSGSIAVTNGTFQMLPASNAIDTNTGTMRVTSASATIQYTSGTFNVDGVITGTGGVQFSGGTINYNTGTYSVTNTTVSGGTVLFAPGTSFTSSNNTLINGGTLNLSTGTSISFKTLTLSNGTLTGLDNFTIGTLNWTGGTLSGASTTATVTGTLTMNDSNVSLDGRTLNNAGSATLGGGSLYLALLNGAVFNNQAGASLQFAHTSTGQITYSTGSGTFNNSGVITKTNASAGLTYISVPFNNSGTITVNGGTLYLNPPSSTTSASSGALQVSTGATVQFAGSGTINFTGTFTGTGTAQFSSGIVNFNSGTYGVTNTTINGGTVSFAAGTSFNSGNTTLSGGTLGLNTGMPIKFNALTMSSGTLTGSDNFTIGTFNWTGGTLSGASTTATVTGTLAMNDSSASLDGRTLNNAGTATLGGGSLYLVLLDGAVFNNQAGASLQFAHTGSGQITYSTGSGTFNNSGVITKPLTSNGFTYIYVPFNNSGSVTVNGGTLYFVPSSPNTDSGPLRVSSGATVQYAGSSTQAFNAGGSLTGAGTILFQSSNVNFNAGSTYAISNTQINGGTADFTSASAVTFGDLTLSYGTLRVGDISVTGDFTQTSGTFTALSGTVAFNGQATQNLVLNSPTTFNNLGVSAGTTLIEVGDANNATVNGTLTNQGTIRKSKSFSGIGSYSFGLASATISVTVQGSLSGATISFVGQTHPAATGTIAPGRYWTIGPSGNGYTVTLTLPQNLATPGQAQVCYFDNVLVNWVCGQTSTTPNTVTLAGITKLSGDWAIGGAGYKVFLPLTIK